MSEKPEVLLAKIKAVDPTGGLKILDCTHGFRDILLVIVPDVEMRLFLWADLKCAKCSEPLSHAISHKVGCCPICGEEYKPGYAFAGETRNYVIGQHPLIDMTLLRNGAFNPILDKLPKSPEEKTENVIPWDAQTKKNSNHNLAAPSGPFLARIPAMGRSCLDCEKRSTCTALCDDAKAQLPSMRQGEDKRLRFVGDLRNGDIEISALRQRRESAVSCVRAKLDNTQLTKKQRQAAERYLWQGESATAIAADLGVGRQAISDRIAAVRRKAR